MDEYAFVRIRTTLCELGDWSGIIEDLDYEFLMAAALGYRCAIWDFSARGEESRACSMGVPWIRYALRRLWLNRIPEPSEQWGEAYEKMSAKARAKLEYCQRFVIAKDVDIVCISSWSDKDDEPEYYRGILKEWG